MKRHVSDAPSLYSVHWTLYIDAPLHSDGQWTVTLFCIATDSVNPEAVELFTLYTGASLDGAQ